MYKNLTVYRRYISIRKNIFIDLILYFLLITLGHKFAPGLFSDATRGLCGVWEVRPGLRGGSYTASSPGTAEPRAYSGLSSEGLELPLGGLGITGPLGWVWWVFSVRPAVNTTDSPGALLDNPVLAGLHTCGPGASPQAQLRAHLKT